jgi:hypothetical protein
MSDGDDLYLIWRAEPVPGWLGDDKWTQSRAVDDAGRFSRDEALSFCQGEIPRAVRAGRIVTLPIRLADMERLLGLEARQGEP